MSYDAMCGYKLSDNNGLGLDVEEPYLFDMTISASSSWNNYDNRWEFDDFIRNKAVEVFTEQEDNAAFDIYVHTKETIQELNNIIKNESQEFYKNINNVLNSQYEKFYFIMF